MMLPRSERLRDVNRDLPRAVFRRYLTYEGGFVEKWKIYRVIEG